jgi:hypothetical protein
MSPPDDPRVVAMAREWCRLIGREPDELVIRSQREQRWLGYIGWCQQLLVVADAVDEVRAEAAATQAA